VNQGVLEWDDAGAITGCDYMVKILQGNGD
jgi:hypothetical protein